MILANLDAHSHVRTHGPIRGDQRNNKGPLTRRAALLQVPPRLFLAKELLSLDSMARASDVKPPSGLAARMAEAGRLHQPRYLAPWDAKIIYYPRWMFGEWSVRSTFIRVTTPLGKRLVPAAFLRSAEAPPEQGGPGSMYTYLQRFYSTLPDTLENNTRFWLGLGSPESAVIADKAYNTEQTTEAFLGYSGAVSQVVYDPQASPLRMTVALSTLGPDMSPLPPRRLELYVNGISSGSDEDNVFRTSELARQVLVTVGDVKVSDYEVLNEYRLEKEGVIQGRQRSAIFLQPQDPLYFETGSDAVAVYDYEFLMERVGPPIDAPAEAVACVQTPKQVFQCI